MVKQVWDNKDTNLPLVIKDASWRFIQDFEGYKSCSGVFVFADSSHKVKYVGYSSDKCIVESISDALKNSCNSDASLVKVLYTTIDKDAKLVADVLIEKYRPDNNSKNKSECKKSIEIK